MDLKPKNILVKEGVDKNGNFILEEIKVADLGCCIKHKHKRATAFNGGTHGFTAPEINGRTLVHEYNADIWSFGMTLKCLVFGENDANICKKNFDSSQMNIDADLMDVITNALKIDPLKRPNARDLIKFKFFSKVIEHDQ